MQSDGKQLTLPGFEELMADGGSPSREPGPQFTREERRHGGVLTRIIIRRKIKEVRLTGRGGS